MGSGRGRREGWPPTLTATAREAPPGPGPTGGGPRRCPSERSGPAWEGGPWLLALGLRLAPRRRDGAPRLHHGLPGGGRRAGGGAGGGPAPGPGRDPGARLAGAGALAMHDPPANVAAPPKRWAWPRARAPDRWRCPGRAPPPGRDAGAPGSRSAEHPEGRPAPTGYADRLLERGDPGGEFHLQLARPASGEEARALTWRPGRCCRPTGPDWLGALAAAPPSTRRRLRRAPPAWGGPGTLVAGGPGVGAAHRGGAEGARRRSRWRPRGGWPGCPGWRWVPGSGRLDAGRLQRLLESPFLAGLERLRLAGPAAGQRGRGHAGGALALGLPRLRSLALEGRREVGPAGLGGARRGPGFPPAPGPGAGRHAPGRPGPGRLAAGAGPGAAPAPPGLGPGRRRRGPAPGRQPPVRGPGGARSGKASGSPGPGAAGVAGAPGPGELDLAGNPIGARREGARRAPGWTRGAPRLRGSPRGSHGPRRPYYPPSSCTALAAWPWATGHELYLRSRQPHGKPVVFLHGGPGGGTEPPASGASSTQSLPDHPLRPARLRPLHALRLPGAQHHLGPGGGTWSCCGGSPGGALAGVRRLLGAAPWPWPTPRPTPTGSASWCCAVIFLLRKWEIDWFYPGRRQPPLPPTPSRSPRKPIPPPSAGTWWRPTHRRLTSPDQRVRSEAARAWSTWEARTSYLLPNLGYVEKMGEDVRRRLRPHRVPLLHARRLGDRRPGAARQLQLRPLRRIPGSSSRAATTWCARWTRPGR